MKIMYIQELEQEIKYGINKIIEQYNNGCNYRKCTTACARTIAIVEYNCNASCMPY